MMFINFSGHARAWLFSATFLLPSGLFLSSLAQERRKRSDPQETLVHPVPRLSERARKFNEQHWQWPFRRHCGRNGTEFLGGPGLPA